MAKLSYFVVIVVLLQTALSLRSEKLKHRKSYHRQSTYEATWQSLDSRPLPSWYDEAKIGIFMHWGVFSVPSFGTEWFWWYWKGAKDKRFVDFMKKNYPPHFSYADFAPYFRAEFFDPNMWADLIAKSGARYFVLTSKHHEGWTNWKSSVSWNWNSVDNGPHRDLVGDLAEAVRNRTNVTFGLYFSLYEWFNPLYLKDKENQFTSQQYVDETLIPQLRDIVKTYRPEYIWSDGDWEANDTYWKSKEFLAWLYNESPVKDSVVVNDRWGIGDSCHHGGVFTCSDRYNPGVLQKHKWENAMTVDKVSWGYRRNTTYSDFLTMDELLDLLASTISCGGNMLINVGPTADGRIDPIFQERLLQLGQWLNVNGEAIYSSKPWRVQNDTLTKGVWYTQKEKAVYAIVLEWPSFGILNLAAPITTEGTTVRMLGLPDTFLWSPLTETAGIEIKFPAVVESRLPCNWAWVLRFENII